MAKTLFVVGDNTNNGEFLPNTCGHNTNNGERINDHPALGRDALSN
jgi:hypothetical protein